MSFKGSFSRYTSNRISGHIFISFSLKCTNLMFGETIDIGIFPSDGSQPWYYRNLKFKAGQTYVFNYDSIDWNWCQGDYYKAKTLLIDNLSRFLLPIYILIGLPL